MRTALALAVCLLAVLAVPAAAAVLTDSEADVYCASAREGETCGPGNGRRTPGGGDKVPHTGWPAVTGVLWQVRGTHDARLSGSAENDELLGHHGSDVIVGGAGRDILWGDWDPRGNTTRQRDRLIGGTGNDFIYPSHGRTVVRAGRGNDYVWAYYGRGVIDCGPGRDKVRVRYVGSRFRLKGCEVVRYFCAHGSDRRGRCLTPTGRVAPRR